MSSGQILGGVIGAVAGYFIPGGGAAMALKGMSLGMTVGGYLDPPKGPTIVGPRLEDLTVQTSTYGSIIPRIYGTIGICGNIFWIENNALKEKVKKSKSGGKGGGGSSTTKTYTYYATFALGLCEGPIVGVRRIWLGSKLWYDAGSADISAIRESNVNSSKFTLHKGSDTQQPDARMQATLGVANTPAYRGLAYIVFNDLPLAKYGNSIQGVQAKIEVIVTGNSVLYAQSLATSPVSTNLTHISWCKTAFVALGQFDTTAIWSPNGKDWRKCNAPATVGYKNKVVRGDNITVMTCNDTRSLASYDNVNWFWITMPEAAWFFALAWNGSYFVAAKRDLIAKSFNGINWTGLTAYPFPGVDCSDLIWGSNFFIALKLNSSQYGISTDCASWNLFYCAYPITSMMYANGQWLAVFDGANKVGLSTNGTDWTYYDSATNFGTHVVWDGEQYVSSVASSKYYTSPNGQTWTPHTISIYAPYAYRSSVFSDGLLCAVYGDDILTMVKYRTESVSPSLANVIESECVKAGLSATDVDVSELSGVVRGYKISSVSAVKSSLIQLQAAFPFDPIQRGYKLKFKPRGGASVVTIPASDLGAVGETV